MVKKNFADIKIGDKATFGKTVTEADVFAFAGITGDFNPIHHDELYAIRAGNDRVFAMGMLSAGFLSRMITDWVGNGKLRKYRVRFGRQVWPGDTITCKGRLTRKYTEGGKNYMEAEVFAENQRAEKVITGTDIIDTALSPFGLRSSHPAIEPLVVALYGTNRDTGHDVEQLFKCGQMLEAVAPKYRDFLDTSSMSVIDTGALVHQIPGGIDHEPGGTAQADGRSGQAD